MKEVHFTAKIVGGPNDGKTVIYDGQAEDDVDVFGVADKMEVSGHLYKIIEYDKDKMHAIIMW